ncbi:MAG: cytochrome C, partial [Gammaproteobacteria bacterium]|nr:cytochrome C [Gammaproteobacteria bacterium]
RKSSGIHWHVNPDVRIRYKSDESRENIYDIELTRQDGTVTLFKGDPAPEGEESPDWKVMDCVDCHNRPSHRYRLPSDEVDMAMVSMDIDHSLPFVKRESMRLLQAGYESHDQARADIPTGLKAFYTTEYPELAGTQADAIARAGDELVEIYTSNVFPAMKVDWGTYPDHSGHQESPGCFRCHDRKHKSEEGAKIPRKCDTCHTLLADEEVDSEILKILNP